MSPRRMYLPQAGRLRRRTKLPLPSRGLRSRAAGVCYISANRSNAISPWPITRMDGSTMAAPTLNSQFGLSGWATTVRSVSTFNAACILAALWAFVRVLRAVRSQMTMTQLRGPPRTSVVFGVSNDLLSSADAASMYEHWAEEYGVVYKIPAVLGQNRIVLFDPRAIAHFYARETWTYVLTPLSLIFIEGLVSQRLSSDLNFLICMSC
jgi:hypothetical protein